MRPRNLEFDPLHWPADRFDDLIFDDLGRFDLPAPSGAVFESAPAAPSKAASCWLVVCNPFTGGDTRYDLTFPVQQMQDPSGPQRIVEDGGDVIPGDVTTPYTLTMGISETGIINSAGDADWFRIALTANEVNSVSIMGIPPIGLPSATLTIYAANGTMLVSHAGPTWESIIVGASGDYFLGVTGAGGATGRYQVAISTLGVDSIPGDWTSSDSITVGGASISSAIESLGDRDWFRIDLVAGQTYEFTLNGVGDSALDDPYLELIAGPTSVISLDDDGGPGLNARMQYTATGTGTYFLAARGFGDSVGDYSLTATTGTPQNPLDTIDLEYTAPTFIEVYFVGAGGAANPFGDMPLRNWTAAEINAAMAALATYSAVTPIVFVQTATRANAEFVLTLSNLEPGELGHFGTVDGVGYGAFAPSGSGWATGLNPGGLGFVTLIHEFGHGLGLDHPHHDGGDVQVMQGVTSPFDDYGDFLLNQGVFTTMSYNSGWPDEDNSVPLTSGYQATPGALDIALLQQRYGVNPNTNAGDTLYTITNYYRTIWDTGGVDTIVAGGSGDARIDLRPATLQSEIGGGGYVSYMAFGQPGGFTIAAGVVIENATGGDGADILIGNSAANFLSGNGGIDRIYFGTGDTVDGGAGEDRVVADYSDSSASWTYNIAQAASAGGLAWDGGLIRNTEGLDFTLGSGNDTLIVTGEFAGQSEWRAGNGVDQVLVDFSDQTANVWLNVSSGYVSIIGTGARINLTSVENYSFAGGLGNDSFSGDGRADEATGGGGADSLDGRDGDDVLNGEAGDDGLQGAAGVDQLFGGDGADTLRGGFGADLLHGGSGDDTLYAVDLGLDGFEADVIDGGDGRDFVNLGYIGATSGAVSFNAVQAATALATLFPTALRCAASNGSFCQPERKTIR